jgi:hypothetical protein
VSVDHYIPEDDMWDDAWEEWYDDLQESTCPTCQEEWDLCSCLDAILSDDHATRRDKKRAAESRMVISGRSTKTVILPMLARRRVTGGRANGTRRVRND